MVCIQPERFAIIFLVRNFRMESTGKPEQVHISEQTCSFLGDNYLLDEGEDVEGSHCNFRFSNRQNVK